MDDLGLAAEEVAQAQLACRWVRVTPGLLPLLRRFLAVRLAENRPLLAGRIANLADLSTFRLWESLKDGESSTNLQGPATPSGRLLIVQDDLGNLRPR